MNLNGSRPSRASSTRLQFRIAQRYFFSRKQRSVINRISWISLISIVVSTMALIIVISVYNGIGDLTKSLFNIFDPQLLVQPVKGKTFHLSTINYNQLVQTPGVEGLSPIVEENAWVTHNQNSAIVQLRGVDSAQFAYFYHHADVTSYPIGAQPLAPIIVGGEIAYRLGLRTIDTHPTAVHIPKRGKGIGFTMEEAFNSGFATHVATLHIQQEIDSRYIVADIDFVRQLMDYSDDECTALAIEVDEEHIDRIKHTLRNQLGDNFTVKDRMDQQPLYYKIFKSERLGIFLIMALIVLIATLNLVASLSLLIIDKRHDIATLQSIGMTAKEIRRTFYIEGLLIALMGVAAGLLLGFVVCFLQQQFGLIKMGDGNFVVQAFPVAMRGIDFVCTFLLVAALSAGAVWFTVRRRTIR